jgi:hypothetical protein
MTDRNKSGLASILAVSAMLGAERSNDKHYINKEPKSKPKKIKAIRVVCPQCKNPFKSKHVKCVCRQCGTAFTVNGSGLNPYGNSDSRLY